MNVNMNVKVLGALGSRVTWWVQHQVPWDHLRQQLFTAIEDVAQRVDKALFTSKEKEEEIRAFWRARQVGQATYWARRGYTDAQTGYNGYPHHGSCHCAWCRAYWTGFRRYLREEKPPAPPAHYVVKLSRARERSQGFISKHTARARIAQAVKANAGFSSVATSRPQ